MKKIILSVAVAALTMCSLSAQSIDDVVAIHLKAIGGEARLKEVKSIEMENTIKIQGLEMLNQTSIIINRAMRSESKVMGSTLVQAFDGSTAWESTPILMGGSGKPQLMADETAGTIINQVDPFPLLDYAIKETKLELIDTENNNFHIRMTPKIGTESDIWINAKTGLASKLKTFQNGQDVEIIFSNYSEINGINFALHMEAMAGMVKIDTKSVKLNNTIDVSIFKMPIIK